MSLSRMNADERASYFVGEAIRRYLENLTWSPEMEATIETLKQVIKPRLTADEWAHVVKVMTFSEHLVDSPIPFGEPRF